MGSLIVSTQMTLDGVIDVAEWYVAEGEHDRAGKAQLARASAVLLGRKTYEGLAAYWSPLKDDWANLINPMPKYVASRSLHGPLEWNSTLLEGDVSDAVSRLKAELPSDLLMCGVVVAPAAHDHGARVLDQVAVHPLEHRRIVERPVVEPHPVLAQPLLRSVIGRGDVAVQ
jgi:hypothetical protein